MFAFLKRRYGFALILGLALAVPLSYFTLGTLGRNRKFAGAPQLPALNAESKNPDTSNRVTSHNASYSVSLDSDNDGIPDAAELQSFMDRENFRRWFTLIAEGQFYRLSKEWNAEPRDCAGLVRFAWREALRRHDRSWFQRMGPEYDALAPEVRSRNLKQGPLGEKLFRTDFGAFKETDLTGHKFSEFADAETLKNF